MDGGRIEIPLDEYKGMKSKIKKLEDLLGTATKHNASLKELYGEAKAVLMDILDTTLTDRIFDWKYYKNMIKGLVNDTAD